MSFTPRPRWPDGPITNKDPFAYGSERQGGWRFSRDGLSSVIATLFSNDEPGFLLTASPDTCFTDTAGTTQAEPGDPVALWLDQSGNDNHATQATSANRPILGRKPKGGVTANSVGSGFDITEPGKEDVYYLFFGSAADPRWMQTPVITPGTDKAQVFAGVRKLSDESNGVIFEHGGSLVDGGIHLFAPDGSLSYRFRSRGTENASVSTIDFSAPISNVITTVSDISSPFAKIFVNGESQDTATSNQGEGNYSAQAMRVGSRNGISNFFNGEIYALTTRFGTNLDVNQIELVERFTASKVAEETIT